MQSKLNQNKNIITKMKYYFFVFLFKEITLNYVVILNYRQYILLLRSGLVKNSRLVGLP